ncbi:DUF3696 domain-containing protein [Geodermatophilus sp. SYSU D01180]
MDQPKLLSWHIADFKSIEKAEVDPRRLTVLAGANSSGKSSLLQALLFLGQSLGEDEPVLNGPLVRLGEPRDVIRSGLDAFTVGVQVEPPAGGRDLDASSVPLRAELSFRANRSGVQPTYFVLTDEDGRTILEATGERVPAADLKVVAEQIPTAATFLRVATLEDRSAPARTYLAFRAALPEALVYKQSEAQLFAAYKRLFKRQDMREDPVLAQQLLFELRNIFEAYRGVEGEVPSILRRLFMQRTPVRESATRFIRDLGPDEYLAVLKELAQFTARREWAVLPLAGRTGGYVGATAFARSVYSPAPTAMRAQFSVALQAGLAVTEALRRLSSSVQYLGPLREEPHVLATPSGGRARGLPVGARGEYTADVLARRAKDRVVYYDWNGERQESALPDAVSRWTAYLGVGEAVDVLDQGKLGRGLRVRVRGVDRDLTTIGVGASQLLPVVAAGLSAPAGAVLLLEQPELHLHPAVQSRLADFFLMARPDVKYLIETHSEYLVTRVRRRVAESRIQPADVDILFAEQDEEGVTRFRNLELNDMGDLSDWPRGFFDAQDDDSRLLIRAVQARLAGGDRHVE